MSLVTVDPLDVEEFWFPNMIGFKRESCSVLSDRRKRRRIDSIVNEFDSDRNLNYIV